MQPANLLFVPPPARADRARGDSQNLEFTLNPENAFAPGIPDARSEELPSPAIDAPQLLASNRPSPQRIADMRYLFSIADNPRANQNEIKALRDYLVKWQLPRSEFQKLKTLADSVVKNYVDAPGSRAVEFSKNWASYSADDRKAVMNDFFQIMKRTMKIDSELGFFDTPQANRMTPAAFYDPNSNKIMININSSVVSSYGLGISSLLHEGVHAHYDQRIRGLSSENIMKNVEAGRLTETDGMLAINISVNGFAPPSEGWMRYSLNPHEQAANGTQVLFNDMLQLRGIPVPPALPPNHPTLERIRRYKL